MTRRWFGELEQRTPRMILLIAVITAVLAVPFLAMAPTESASTEPGGQVFDARDLIDDRFVSSVHGVGYMAEHESGDLLRAEPLRELLAAEQSLRGDPELGPTLFGYYDAEAKMDFFGPVSIADVINNELHDTRGYGLDQATDDDVALAASTVIDRFGETDLLLGLSQRATQVDGRWVVPAVFMNVVSDDTVLGFGNLSITLGGDTDVEDYDRDVQQVLRQANGWEIYGIAIDVNLTSQEQGAVAGPFIGFTVLAALLLVGLTFRSYWVLATVSALFLVLLVWLKGVSNLIGFKDDLVLSLIVPIAMISFGVDYAFHSIGRYREERQEGKVARVAVASGAAAVSSALVLATMSDSVAFLANTTAGIESIVQFGIGAAIALFGAYLLLGVAAPFIVGWIESAVPPPAVGRKASATRVAGAVGASMLAMASVLLLVFVLPPVGLVLGVVTVIATLVVPLIVQRRKLAGPAVGDLPLAGDGSRAAELIGKVVAGLAMKRAVVLPLALVVSVVAAIFAVQVPARFDVEDFFSADTDFVVGLDLVADHVGDRNGEPAKLYIEGDLTDPAALAALASAAHDVRAIDSPVFARQDGDVRVHAGVLEVIDEVWDSPVMPKLIAEQTGIELTDVNGDAIPDTREQMQALLGVASTIGVPIDQDRLAMTPDDVNVSIDLGDLGNGEPDATVWLMQIINSDDQAFVTEARDQLAPIAEALSAELGGSFVQSTGSAFLRQASLEGTNRALGISLPIAVLACLAVATIFLRSLRYGLASIVPILMVVSWLYAFMYATGYAINLVTATIAAVSIGIGIDFALHYISRYREELDRYGERLIAVRVAGQGSGLALAASALSSAVGFGILALAPMPLFAAYGLLTALMIMMALVATLGVLPSLLVAITKDGDR